MTFHFTNNQNNLPVTYLTWEVDGQVWRKGFVGTDQEDAERQVVEFMLETQGG